MLMSATGSLRRCRSICLQGIRRPDAGLPIPARARPGLEGCAEAEFQGDGPQHGLAAIGWADEENRMVPGSGDHQGPLRHFVSVNDAGGILAVGGGLRSPGDFVGGLAVESRQFAIGKGEKIHGYFPRGSSLRTATNSSMSVALSISRWDARRRSR